MLVKGFVLTALVASTPLAFVATQDPHPAPASPETAANELAKAKAEVQRLEALTRKNATDLAGARRELEAARADLDQLRKQLEGRSMHWMVTSSHNAIATARRRVRVRC